MTFWKSWVNVKTHKKDMFLDSVWSWVLYRIVQSLLQLLAAKEWRHWKTWSHCWCKTIITLTNRKKKLTDSQRKQKVERFIGWINKMIWHETFSVFLANWTNTIKNCSEPFFFWNGLEKNEKSLKACAKERKCLVEDFENLLRETYGRELEKAMKKGYVIVTLLEVWYFPETLEGLFRDYENTWFKIKEEASGWQAKVGDDCLQSPWRYRSRPFQDR